GGELCVVVGEVAPELAPDPPPVVAAPFEPPAAEDVVVRSLSRSDCRAAFSFLPPCRRSTVAGFSPISTRAVFCRIESPSYWPRLIVWLRAALACAVLPAPLPKFAEQPPVGVVAYAEHSGLSASSPARR